jgi:TatD DNase family protein
MLVDSHCHLDFPDFAAEIDDVVGRATAAGIGCMLTICTRPDRLADTIALVDRFPMLYGAAGVHPHEAKDFTDLTVEGILALTEHPKMVGIGETGLDYHYGLSSAEAQQESFRRHIRAARIADLPVIVHTRDAEDDTLRILAEEGQGGDRPPLRGIIHCFSGTRQLAEESVKLGLHISLSGIVTFNRSEDIRDTAKDLPLDRILVETDAPYLAPVPKRGKRNEPAFVAHTAQRVAELHGLSSSDFARRTSDNFFNLFTKIPKQEA